MQKKPDQKPNVILICADQMRADCIVSAGHPVIQTPYLNQLCMRGTRFDRAYAACPSCVPARASLYTGLNQRTHGRVGYQDAVPWNYPVTLAGEFSKNGYQTQAIGKMHVYPERSLMGFHNVVLHDGYLHVARSQNARNLEMIDDYIPWLSKQLGRQADYFEHGLNCNSYTARPWDKEEYLHPTNFIVHEAIKFLKERDETKPFMLYLSFHRPHPPLDPPAWAFEQYMNIKMPPPPVGKWTEMLKPWHQNHAPDLSCGILTEEQLRRARAGYYGHITHMDHQINRFLEILHEFGVAQNSYVCFLADHGDMLGDHNLYRKSLPYEGSARVPLIISGPGIKRNCASKELIELSDVMPTLLECADLPIPESIEGHSFLPLAKGEKANGERQFVHGEHPIFMGGGMQYIVKDSYKYIWFSKDGHEQLFNLNTDPQEMEDLSKHSSSKETLTSLRNLLVKELSGREEGYSDGSKLITGRPARNVLSHALPSSDDRKKSG